jgi:N-acetylglucosamine-6-phosphate deacetylase
MTNKLDFSNNGDLILQGLNVHTEYGVLTNAAVTCSGSILAKIDKADFNRTENVLEFPDSWHLVPGFIDLHTHGTNGADTMDATLAALETMSKSLVKEGVTGFLATTITAAPITIEHTVKNVAAYMAQQENILGAEVLGVHLEGPFLSKEQAGAQKLEFLIPPNIELFKTWQQAANNNIRIVALAPELPNSIELIKYLKQHNIVAAIGHTAASFEQANAAIIAGASEATHLFNCMPQLHHRTPGALLALLLSDKVMGEIIADGYHLHPDILKLAYKLKGSAHNVLITDSMRAKNLADGVYDLGGQQVTVKAGKAHLASGTIAGSTLNLSTAIKNIMHYTDCSFTEALQMVTINPAKQINLFDRKGSIAEGKDADLVVLDEYYQVKMTIVRGQVAFNGTI